jgi:hypothetical protein
VLAWQLDRVVRKPQRNYLEREIGERDVLGEDYVAVAVFADERCGVVRSDRERPDLEPLGGAPGSNG